MNSALLICSSSLLLILLSAAEAAIALPGCPTTCGNISIPFPFGTSPNCFLNPWYEIDCRQFLPFNTTKQPFLTKLNIQVLQIVLLFADFTNIPIQIIKVSIPPMKVCTSNTHRHRLTGIDLRKSPYNFSTDSHTFLMEGCAGSTALVDHTGQSLAGCTTICRNNNNTAIRSTDLCYGVECCQMKLPSPPPKPWLGNRTAVNSTLQFYHIDFYGQGLGGSGECMVATMIKEGDIDGYRGELLKASSDGRRVPVELGWSWISSSLPVYNPRQATCVHDETSNTTLCSCNKGSFGNPYLYDGCHVVKECRHCSHGSCVLIAPNRYKCSPNEINPILGSIMEVFLPIALGPLLIWLIFRWLQRFITRRSKTAQRVMIFKLKLEQHQSTSDGVVERTKLFTHNQLDKATNHFNENRVLGRGGQGIVYKGMLDDGRTVAVKKLKMMDESEMEQFINEVVILSQINHRNVVKLLGCCLGTEIPLLVYEYIPNGTLFQHIHHPDEDFDLSWAMRLKIAAGAAGAIAYLHSYSSISVYHRDIKSSNILLDEKYIAKVTDFGSSKTTSIEDTHLTTLVRGTWGYLDPEYFQSNKFTDKSDVYSFGVVLLELLTRKKPIFKDETMEHKSLVTEFQYIESNSRLFEFLDPQDVSEAKADQLTAIADLAKRCLNGSGRLRPSMKEVAMTLEMIMKSGTEVLMHEQQSFLMEEFDEISMAETSDCELMSRPHSVDFGNALYIDVHPPLLHQTI